MNLHFQNENEQKAKEFLQLVSNPPVDGTGILLAEDIRNWRYNNQISVLSKAEKIIKERNAPIRKVSLKVLADLLEQSSLEEEVSLQDRWAALFANTVTENSQINSVLYSQILGQLTKQDAEVFAFISKVSTQTDKNEEGERKFKVTFSRFAYIKKDDINKIFPNAYVSNENLIRLRLVKEPTNMRFQEEHIIMTDLGFRFAAAIDIY